MKIKQSTKTKKEKAKKEPQKVLYPDYITWAYPASPMIDEQY